MYIYLFIYYLHSNLYKITKRNLTLPDPSGSVQVHIVHNVPHHLLEENQKITLKKLPLIVQEYFIYECRCFRHLMYLYKNDLSPSGSAFGKRRDPNVVLSHGEILDFSPYLNEY